MNKLALLSTLVAVSVAGSAVAETTSTTTVSTPTTTTSTTTKTTPVEVTLADGSKVYTTLKDSKTYVYKSSDMKTAVGAGTWQTTDGKTIVTGTDGSVTVK